VKPLLIFGYGNPGRGDDALGPAFVDTVEAMGLELVECQTDMQLQVEHVTDLSNRRLILFVDADIACQHPFQLSEIRAERDDSYTSHAMTPQALLHAYGEVYHLSLPAAFLLRIRGDSFELGEDLSSVAHSNLHEAVEQFRPLMDSVQEERWRDFAKQGAGVTYA